jgi:hypothetical protein
VLKAEIDLLNCSRPKMNDALGEKGRCGFCSGNNQVTKVPLGQLGAYICVDCVHGVFASFTEAGVDLIGISDLIKKLDQEITVQIPLLDLKRKNIYLGKDPTKEKLIIAFDEMIEWFGLVGSFISSGGMGKLRHSQEELRKIRTEKQQIELREQKAKDEHQNLLHESGLS